MTVEIIVTVILSAAVGALLLWFWLGRGKKEIDPTENLQQTVKELNKNMLERMDRVSDQMERRLQENVKAMNESKSFLAERVSSTEKTVREVSTSLGKLEHATQALKSSTEEISNFQRLLKSPKVRGSFGEVLLTNLLSDVLPADRYRLQHTLPSSGEIADAVILLQDGYLVAIDAKFPLANYELLSQAEDPTARKQARSALERDVKKHINDISKKYISPSDTTLDYAFMYIPMEGVYYETMVRASGQGSLWDFCLQHKVVPVSPNSFLAYLQTILVGLKGMKIEQQAHDILASVRQARKDFMVFSEDFTTVGKHLMNAKNRYDDSARRLDKFSNRLESLEGGVDNLPEGD